MRTISITNPDGELIGLFETNRYDEQISKDIDEVYKEWFEEDESNMSSSQEFMNRCLPVKEIYPVDIENFEIKSL